MDPLEEPARRRSSRPEVERVQAELEDFVYTVSHDLNSPLISILGYVDLFESDFGADLTDEGKLYLERIKVSGRFMQSLIAGLLDLSRVGRVQTEPEVVDLHSLIHEIADEIRADAPEAKIRLNELPAIYMNPMRAKQLFSNLIQNSVKYADRSDIMIEVSADEASNGLVTLTLTDNGPGIPVDRREKVFGVFERLDSSRSGTGMGLAVCKRIVETNGGLIWIADSELGTDVRFSVPIRNSEGSST